MKFYKLIYADPPWIYDNKRTGGSFKSGSSQKYEVMNLDDIKNLPIIALTDKDSYCFLWITVPLLPEGLEVLKSWGFIYKTALFWDKQKLGLGNYFRGQIEILLIGKKGNPPAFKSQGRNLISKKSTIHSKKPAIFYTILENLNLNPKIELFARERREGWDVFGNELPNTLQKLLTSNY